MLWLYIFGKIHLLVNIRNLHAMCSHLIKNPKNVHGTR